MQQQNFAGSIAALRVALVLVLALGACGDDDDDAARDAAIARDAGVDAAPDECAEFVAPARADTSACAALAPGSDPRALVACAYGSGHAGGWAIDGAGLPAYDFAIDQRCDPAGRAYSPRPRPQRDPVHLIGNGRGLMAMARASGAIELYSQDRGHKWITRHDTWRDPVTPGFPPQLGGGFSYLALPDGTIGSTRFEDLPLATAATQQTRRFGVGYVETVTTFGALRVTRRVLAPDAEARALVAEITVENTGAVASDFGLIELWDPNRYDLSVELATSDVLMRGVTDRIDRRRRAFNADFDEALAYDAVTRVATLRTTARALPAGVDDRLDPSPRDWFPDPLYLASLDEGVMPDAVWLDDAELWDGDERAPPPRAAAPGDASSRTLARDGSGQHAVLAMRVPLSVAPGARVVRRFAFGYVPGGGAPDAALAELRGTAPSIAADTERDWRTRLVYASFPGLPHAGAVQRELAWAAYNTLATTSYDEYHQTRVVGQGGSYRYVHGLDGAMGDLCLFADAVTLLDPALAAETLVYVMSTQHAGAEATPWRYPYATTGVGNFSDVGLYDQRTDVYWLLPSSLARHVALSRDAALLEREVPYWPRALGESANVVDHVARGLDWAEALGYGARGFVALGTNDYADGVTSLSDEPATPTGTSSTYNAGFIVNGFPLAADVIDVRDPALATRLRGIEASQRSVYLSDAWLGSFYARGFVDSGNPLAPGLLFLEPQMLAILGGITDDARADALLALVGERLETPLGAMSTVALDPLDPVGGPTLPQIAGVWPVANAWTTEAYAQRDATAGWDSFTRNTLFTHAAEYPDLWYGIWTGPDSFFGPDAERPGEADAHLATALTDYPALNTHIHTSPLRALLGILGIRGTRDGIAIAPHVPTETFHVVFPRLSLRSTPARIDGTYTPVGAGAIVFRVRLTSALTAASALEVDVDGARVSSTRDGDDVVFTADGAADVALAWSVAPAT